MQGKIADEEMTRELEEQTESVDYFRASTEEEKSTKRPLKGDQRKDLVVMSPSNKFKEVPQRLVAPEKINPIQEKKVIPTKKKQIIPISERQPFIVNGVVMDGRDWRYFDSPASNNSPTKRNKKLTSDNSCPVLSDILMVQEHSSIAKNSHEADDFVEDMSEIKVGIHEYTEQPSLKSKKSSPTQISKVEPVLPQESILKRSPRRKFTIYLRSFD